MDHIGDSFIRKSIQRIIEQAGCQFVSVARYDTDNRGQFWVAVVSRGDAPEEMVFTSVGGRITIQQCDPTYRTQEPVWEE